MLVLGLKIGETIVINDNIKLNFIKVRENKIRVAVDAPKEVPISRYREEEGDNRGFI